MIRGKGNCLRGGRSFEINEYIRFIEIKGENGILLSYFQPEQSKGTQSNKVTFGNNQIVIDMDKGNATTLHIQHTISGISRSESLFENIRQWLREIPLYIPQKGLAYVMITLLVISTVLIIKDKDTWVYKGIKGVQSSKVDLQFVTGKRENGKLNIRV